MHMNLASHQELLSAIIVKQVSQQIIQLIITVIIMEEFKNYHRTIIITIIMEQLS